MNIKIYFKDSVVVYQSRETSNIPISCEELFIAPSDDGKVSLFLRQGFADNNSSTELFSLTPSEFDGEINSLAEFFELWNRQFFLQKFEVDSEFWYQATDELEESLEELDKMQNQLDGLMNHSTDFLRNEDLF